MSCDTPGGTVSGGAVVGGTVSGGAVVGGTVSGGAIVGGTVSGGTVSGGAVVGGTVSGGTVGPASWRQQQVNHHAKAADSMPCKYTTLPILQGH